MAKQMPGAVTPAAQPRTFGPSDESLVEVRAIIRGVYWNLMDLLETIREENILFLRKDGFTPECLQHALQQLPLSFAGFERAIGLLDAELKGVDPEMRCGGPGLSE